MDIVGLRHRNVMSQGLGTAAHQLTDIFQSEDLFITHLNGVVNRKVMFLKNGKIDMLAVCKNKRNRKSKI